MRKTPLKSSLLLGATMAASLGYGAAAAADEPLFSSVALDRAYVQMAGNEGSCGEGKCGDDKGGEGSCGGDKDGEGKCGEGKCGSA